jgi:hypothetical protein
MLVSVLGCSAPGRLSFLRQIYSPSVLSSDTPAAAAPGESSRAPIRLVSASGDLREVPLGQRIVIYSAAIRIVARDVDAAVKSMEQIADDLGGYVQRIDGNKITIRVPVADYRLAISRVEALGRVIHRQQEATDVTEEFVDLEARLKNALAVRARLEALLARTEGVMGALEVERELKRIGEEIEQLQAKLELIKNRVALTTITAEFGRVARRAGVPAGLGGLPFAWLRELDPSRLWRD